METLRPNKLECNLAQRFPTFFCQTYFQQPCQMNSVRPPRVPNASILIGFKRNVNPINRSEVDIVTVMFSYNWAAFVLPPEDEEAGYFNHLSVIFS